MRMKIHFNAQIAISYFYLVLLIGINPGMPFPNYNQDYSPNSFSNLGFSSEGKLSKTNLLVKISNRKKMKSVIIYLC